MCRFRPRIFFPGVVAPLAADLGRLDALAVDDRGARLRIPAGPPPHGLAQRRVDPLPSAVEGPDVEVIADAVVIGEVLRQQPPLAAGPRQVQDGVDHLPQVQLARATRPRPLREQRLQQRPLLVRQIRRIAPTRRASHPSIPSAVRLRGDILPLVAAAK
jgi:hypothetical protein